jgi:DNA-binding XRE family transcriptional regulator
MKKAKKTKLAEYLEEEGIMQNVFAKKINTSPPTLLAILRGERLPALDLAFRIQKITHGKVKMTDWFAEVE